MTVQSLLDALGWSRDYAAGRCQVSTSTMRYWAQGLNSRGNPAEPPAWVAQYLQACLRALDRVPLKKG